VRTPYRGPLRAVILDWAGTTVDFGSLAPVAVLQELFLKHGIPISIGEARRGMGLLKKDHIRSILAQPRILDAWTAARGRPPAEPDVERLFAEFTPRQIVTMAEHSDVIPGVPAAIAEMRRRGLRIGSTTGYTRAMLDSILPRAAAAGYAPDASVTPDETGAGRPAPWMCYLNMQRLGVFPPAACVKIGDTPADIHEGQNAGMWTIGVIDSGNEIGLSPAAWNKLDPAEQTALRTVARQTLLAAGADFTVDTLSGIAPILDEIERIRL